MLSTPQQNLNFFSRIERLCGRRYRRLRPHYSTNRSACKRHTFDRPVKDFSKGMRQKLGIAIATAKRISIMVSRHLVKILSHVEFQDAYLGRIRVEYVQQQPAVYVYGQLILVISAVKPCPAKKADILCSYYGTLVG